MLAFREILEKCRKIDFHLEIHNRMHLIESHLDNKWKMLVLLYEFPAETRLTVYRRLDMSFSVGLDTGAESSPGGLGSLEAFEVSWSRRASTLRDLRAETRWTVYRAFAIRK